MKKNIGNKLALYPSLLAVIGAWKGNVPTWTLVAHMGIIGHNQVLVSLAKPHDINAYIKKTGKLTINLVSTEMLPHADYTGAVSGAKTDKSQVFAYHTGEAGGAMITESPLTMECTVQDVYLTDGFESFICTIDNTYVEEGCLNENGVIDYEKLKPVLFQFPSYQYLSTGNVLGKCLTFHQKSEAAK